MLCSHAEVIDPKTLEEALRARAERPDAMPVAGGTDVMVFLEGGAIDPPAFLNLWGLDELRRIDRVEGGAWVGALTVYTDLIRHPAMSEVAPTLVEAARTVGAVQIQNRGTLGGNIANGSPAGDTLPVLLAQDAQIEVASAARGYRLIPMDALYTGYRTLAMEADELITRVWLPAPDPADRMHFRKVGTRLAQAISKVIVATRLRVEGGQVTLARVALGSVGPVPARARSVEAALLGGPVDAGAADRVADDITPIDDVRSTATYRSAAARRVLRSMLAASA